MADVSKSAQGYYETLAPPVRDIARALDRAISERFPRLTTKLAWGFPCWSGSERIFSVIGHGDRCNLQLWAGARLAADFKGRIEGTGKSLRHVKIHSVGDIDAELVEIMERAVALDAEAPERVR